MWVISLHQNVKRKPDDDDDDDDDDDVDDDDDDDDLMMIRSLARAFTACIHTQRKLTKFRWCVED